MSIQAASHVQHKHLWLDPKSAQNMTALAGLGSAESIRKVAYHHSRLCFFGGHLQLGLQGNELLLHVGHAALCGGQLFQTHLIPFLHCHHLSTAWGIWQPCILCKHLLSAPDKTMPRLCGSSATSKLAYTKQGLLTAGHVALPATRTCAWNKMHGSRVYLPHSASYSGESCRSG